MCINLQLSTPWHALQLLACYSTRHYGGKSEALGVSNKRRRKEDADYVPMWSSKHMHVFLFTPIAAVSGQGQINQAQFDNFVPFSFSQNTTGQSSCTANLQIHFSNRANDCCTLKRTYLSSSTPLQDGILKRFLLVQN